MSPEENQSIKKQVKNDKGNAPNKFSKTFGREKQLDEILEKLKSESNNKEEKVKWYEKSTNI